MNELLAGLERSLAEQAAALRDGDADALPALAQAVRDQLVRVAREARALRPSDRARVAHLLRLCRESDAMLQRRLYDTRRTLQALAAAAPGAADGPVRGALYGPQGLLAPASRGPRGFAAA